ncbi:MAG: translation initiation factor IF-2 [Lachnospiraceae bacterium]|nr:translation initiation factor IF-2 [Lachnospiraceae bacterium]
MAKKRVHELAKELKIESKEIVDFFAKSGVKMTASSGLDEESVSRFMASRGKKTISEDQNSNPAPANEPKKAGPSKENKDNEASSKPSSRPTDKKPAAKDGDKKPPKKKSSITAVFNAQYSKNSRNDNKKKKNDDRPSRDNRKEKKAPSQSNNQGGFRPAGGHSVIKPRPESERTVRPRPSHAEEEDIIFKKPAPKKSEPEKAQKDASFGKKQFDSHSQPKNQKNQNHEKPGKNSPAMNNAEPAKQDNRKPDNRNGGKKKKGNNNDHDALGSKKQERYVNLEKNGGKKKTKGGPKKETRNEDEILTLTLPEHLTIRELADKMKVQPSAIVKKLFLKGTMITVNSDVDYDTAEEIALEFNCVCEPEEKVDVIAELLKEDEDSPETLVSRPPVVCVMGHVDHGKTSLLDAIRNTHVIDREAGGITQKIGAYIVNIGKQKITFLDTPGHEAFTAMRMRGASSTDIAILVVAADDGVMPQTVEAINHAKAAGIEIIVAINKIDKPGANIDRVKQELSEYELIPEDWGGSTIFVPVSAHTGEGIDQLLEMILLTAEVLELKANPKRNARGMVIEAELDKGRGVVATVLVQKGTLHVGDPVAAGSSFGKVRAMLDEHGRRVKKAKPSTPVEILGLSEVPNAGEIFQAFDNEKESKNFAQTFVSVGKEALIEETKSKMSLDDLFSQIQAGNVKELDIIVKADVQGSVEAVRSSLEKLSNEEVVVKIIHGGVGAITESDVNLAAASNAIIIGFNVRPDNIAKQTADNEGVDIRLYKVIYNAIEDVEAAMKGMLEPVYEEKVIGHAYVRQIFKSSDVGNIAGSFIDDGYFARDCKVRITRGDNQVYEGALASLKRFKDDVKEVKAGYECGLVFDGFSEIMVDDFIEAYIMVEVPR